MYLTRCFILSAAPTRTWSRLAAKSWSKPTSKSEYRTVPMAVLPRVPVWLGRISLTSEVCLIHNGPTSGSYYATVSTFYFFILLFWFSAGVIDEDYRGNVGVILFNHSDQDFVVNSGDRVAQLICEKIAYPKISEFEVPII